MDGQTQRCVDGLRATMRALPEDTVPAEVWATIERRVFLAPPQRVARRTASIAAAAALVAVIATSLWHNAGERMDAAENARAERDLLALVEQSQRLERALLAELESRGRIGLGDDDRLRWQSSRDALLYRLTDIDDELVRVSADDERERAERLWRERVEIMRSLGELERVEKWRAVQTVVF